MDGTRKGDGMSKEIFKGLAERVQAQIDGCECGGSGRKKEDITPTNVLHQRYMPDQDITIPCPTCTPWRELVKELECEVRDSHGRYHGTSYPDLTTTMKGSMLLIVHLMIEAGFWEGFVEWLNENIETVCYANPEDDCNCYRKVAKILVTGKYLVPVIRSWLEVV